jgi:hypothetical protein
MNEKWGIRYTDNSTHRILEPITYLKGYNPEVF